MKLIHKFHKMEFENNLFDLGKEINLPIWDIIRYAVYVKYYYPEKDRAKVSQAIGHSFVDYFKIVLKAISLILKIFTLKNEIVILTASRYIDTNGKYYDKSALPIINALKGKHIVLEPILGKRVAYDYLYDFSNLFRRFYKSEPLPLNYWEKIDSCLCESLGSNLITYEEVNSVLKIYRSDHFFYKKMFSLIKNKKLIICTGNPKGSLQAAKDLGIETYLIQHAGIEEDEIDYSYPKGITSNSFILFPDYVLTFGEYWCKDFNVPSNILAIGNDFFCSKPKVESDDSILIVSTIVHGGELSKFALSLAKERDDLKIVYKLHPNEFHLKEEYIEFFKFNSNISVISSETDTSVLIARSQLVVLIVSAVIYEALNQNKRVAVLKKINYERQLHLEKLNNLYFFDTVVEINKILLKEKKINSLSFYKETDYEAIQGLMKLPQV